MFPLIALMVGIFAFGAQSDVGDVIQRIFTCIESSIYLFVLPILFIISVNQHMAVSGTWAAVCSDTPPKNFFDRPLGLYLILSGISYAAALFFMMLRISPHAHGLVAPKSAWLSMGIFCSITAVTVFFICIRCDSPAKIFKTRLKFSIFVLQYSLPHAVFTAVIVWTGLKVSPSPNRVYQDFWQYPLMGFVVSIAIGTTLFYGKHKIEKRSETDRTECDEAVQVILDGLELQTRLINKSANGSMLRLAHTHIMLQKNARIEIIFRDGIKKIGAIVEAKTNNLNVAYQG